MKKIIKLWTIAMLSILTVFTSCSKDNADVIPEPTPTPTPTPTPEPETKTAKYTVMFYACAGGNLDEYLLSNLKEIAGGKKKDSINFVGLAKYSVNYQTVKDRDGVRYMTMTKEGLTDNKKYEINYRMDDPANLTAFINDAKKNFPAQKYILILWNHGGEFGNGEKLVQTSYPTGTRAALYDDNISKADSIALSTYELEKAIKDSGTKLDLIYFDCCLMGMAETYYQLKDCAHYGMATLHLTPGLGGDYTLLMDNLQNKPTLEEAIKDYVPKCVDGWHEVPGQADSLDLECYDLSYMEELKEKVTPVATYLQSWADGQHEGANVLFRHENFYEANHFAIINGEKPNLTTSVDLYSTVNRMAQLQNDETLAGYAADIKSTLDKMTIAEKCYVTPKEISKISMGITWPTSTFWHAYNAKGYYYGMGSYAVYPTGIDNSAFLQGTGWGKFLTEFSNNFNYLGENQQ